MARRRIAVAMPLVLNMVCRGGMRTNNNTTATSMNHPWAAAVNRICREKPNRLGIWDVMPSGQMLRQMPGVRATTAGATGINTFQKACSPMRGKRMSAMTIATPRNHRRVFARFHHRCCTDDMAIARNRSAVDVPSDETAWLLLQNVIDGLARYYVLRRRAPMPQQSQADRRH